MRPAYVLFYIDSIRYVTSFFMLANTEINLLQRKLEVGEWFDAEDSIKNIVIVHQKALS